MPKFGSGEFRTVEEYRRAAETLARLTGFLLFEFARHPLSKKDLILRNMAARTITMVRGIVTLWDVEDFQDCWILHRCLVDRYFHVVALGKDNSYEAFDDWSYVKQFEAQHRIISDPRCEDIPDTVFFKPTVDQKARYAELKKNPPKWHRPKVEEVAKQSGLDFLYSYSYDYSSCFVHPMADDGHEDFHNITKLQPRPEFPSYITVLHNTILIGCLLIIEVLNQSNFQWRAIVYNFYDKLLKNIENGTVDYFYDFAKIGEMGANSIRLCEPAS